MIKFDDKIFNSKKRLVSYLQYKFKSDLPHAEELFLDLLSYHPDSAEKIGVGIHHFFPCFGYGGYLIPMFQREDGSHDDFSIRKCVNHLPEYINEQHEAGLKRFKKLSVVYEDSRCSYCNCLIEVGDYWNPNPAAIKKYICDPCLYREKEAQKEYWHHKFA
jgi:hypothetical protein